MPLNPGQILNNRYRIVKLLGQGGFGAVYKAWDIPLNRPCALKESFKLSPHGQSQFINEAQILAKLTHPNLPRVTDFFDIPGQGQYLVMDFVEGQDLEELRTQAGGRLPETQVLGWISQVCDALSYLHRQKPPVIHRDIKPANIKIAPPDEDYPQGRAMLVDFGIAKTFDQQKGTTEGARAVTPGYSPYEQYGQTASATDARSDIYALGATLYMLLTGQLPEESVLRVGDDPLVLPGQLNPDITPQTEAAILKAIQIIPDHRFQSAGEFKKVISGQVSVGRSRPTMVMPTAPRPATRGVTGVGVIPATAEIPRPPPNRPFPWKWVGIAAGLLAVLAVVIVVAGLLALDSTSDKRLTGTAQARDSQTAEKLADVPVLTITPTSVSPSPTSLLPSLTPSPLHPTSSPTLGTGSTQISPQDGMVLVYIPAGTFQMGSNSGDSDEKPVHTVTLDAFWIDRTEITNAMYARCVSAGQCTPPSSSGSFTRVSYYGNSTFDNYPVIAVTWNQANAYCSWALRGLPTEAQWEYAARGGLAGATYPWGEGIDCTRANYMPSSTCVDDTSEVGSYPAYGYGLYDMAGNVWEWVADWFSNTYSSTPSSNPTGPASGAYRVIRGGTWDDDANSLRVANRYSVSPERQNASIGFRCAISP